VGSGASATGRLRRRRNHLAAEYDSDAMHRTASDVRRYAATEAEIASPVPIAT
jgi:hypothetical protein